MLSSLLLPLLLAAVAARKQPQIGRLQRFNLDRLTWEEYMSILPSTVKEDMHLSFVALVKKYNYPVESHYVTTKDGYNLKMFRIPYGRGGPGKARAVAYLQHGIICSADDWILPGPEKSLAYILADKGYDVWLGNARGTKHSRNHTALDPVRDAKKFWDFSWHEIGSSDTPSMIDYILETTGRESLFYIGYSQGSTAYYVMMSEWPEYNRKIRAHFSLAPIAFMSHMTSLFFHFVATLDVVGEVAYNLIGLHEFVPNESLLHKFAQEFCKVSEIMNKVCANVLFVGLGFNPDKMNYTLLPIIIAHTPAGAATKQLIHYAQVINSGKFRQYDYKLDNFKLYQSSSPPDYNLSRVTAPVYLFYSGNDWLSSIADVQRLHRELENVGTKRMFLVPDEEFNHLDYMFATNADTAVYSKVITLMARH